MTTIELLGVVLGGGTVSAVVGGVTTAAAARAQRAADAKKADASVVVASIEADGKTEASLADVMRDILADMRAERVHLVAAAATEAARLEARAEEAGAKHVDCLKLVGEMGGRIDLLEPRLNRAEVALEDCEKKHSEAAAELATFKRSVANELSKRPPSNPGFPAAKKE